MAQLQKKNMNQCGLLLDVQSLNGLKLLVDNTFFHHFVTNSSGNMHQENNVFFVCVWRGEIGKQWMLSTMKYLSSNLVVFTSSESELRIHLYIQACVEFNRSRFSDSLELYKVAILPPFCAI